jgi:hypothetical protein
MLLEFGCLAQPLSVQLKGQFPASDLKILDRLATAINLLKVQGLITEKDAERAEHRLTQRIAKWRKSHG